MFGDGGSTPGLARRAHREQACIAGRDRVIGRRLRHGRRGNGQQSAYQIAPCPEEIAERGLGGDPAIAFRQRVPSRWRSSQRRVIGHCWLVQEPHGLLADGTRDKGHQFVKTVQVAVMQHVIEQVGQQLPIQYRLAQAGFADAGCQRQYMQCLEIWRKHIAELPRTLVGDDCHYGKAGLGLGAYQPVQP